MSPRRPTTPLDARRSAVRAIVRPLVKERRR